MSEHTPGPWSALRHSWGECSVVAGPDRTTIAALCAHDDEEDVDDRAMNDARLMASAPDLLAENTRLRSTCESLREALGAAARSMEAIGLGWEEDFTIENVRAYANSRANVARTALAKAGGSKS